MQGVEVIFSNQNRRVWKANGFYLEQLPPSAPGGRLGDETQLVIARKPIEEYKPWDPDDPTTHEAPKNTRIRPEDVLSQVVLARIPTGRYCYVFPIELDEDGTTPPRETEWGWTFDAAKAEPEPKEPLPHSEVGPDKLPMAPRRVKTGA
jgi:hypothetical protein